MLINSQLKHYPHRTWNVKMLNSLSKSLMNSYRMLYISWVENLASTLAEYCCFHRLNKNLVGYCERLHSKQRRSIEKQLSETNYWRQHRVKGVFETVLRLALAMG